MKKKGDVMWAAGRCGTQSGIHTGIDNLGPSTIQAAIR
jgi:hypothetical protein